MLHRTFNFLSLFLLLGCGDQLVGPEFLGKPLFELNGTVTVAEPDANFGDNIDLALVWYGRGQDLQVARSFTTTRFPASFKMQLFEAPKEDALQQVPDHDTAQFAVGRLLAFQDLDRDGKLEVGEPLLGGAFEHVVTYFTEDTKSAIVEEPVDRGFRLKTLLGCLDREDLWMADPPSKNVGLFVDSFPSDFSTDLDCDEQPEDICLEALILMESEGDQLDEARELYNSENCELIFGCLEPEDCGFDTSTDCEDSPDCEQDPSLNSEIEPI